MAKGRQARALRPDQIRRLERFRRQPHPHAPHGYSLPQLRSALGLKVGWRTVQNALLGRPIAILSWDYIAQWLDRFVPAPPVRDGKAAAAEDDAGKASDGHESPEFETDPNVPADAKALSGRGREMSKEDAKEEAGAARTVRGSR